MIQEIYDYLLTRSHFLTNKELMLEMGKDKGNFKIIVDGLADLMQKENYLLTSKEIRNNVSDFIFQYRFNNNRNKDVNDNMNYIIGRLNEYDAMSDSRKRYLVKEWLKNEFKDRNLPYVCQTPDTIFNAMANEHSLFMKMNGYELNEEMGCYEFVSDDQTYTQEEIDIFDYLQLLNLLCSRYPAYFYELENSENALANMEEILATQKSTIIRKYTKRTFKNLKSVLKDVEELKQELNVEKRLKI